MENKLFKIAIAKYLIIVMVVTTVFVPVMIDSDGVYAYNSTPSVTKPANIYAGKNFAVTIKGDVTTSTDVAIGTVAYKPQTFTITYKYNTVRKEILNGAVSTTFNNINLPNSGTDYRFVVYYTTEKFNGTIWEKSNDTATKSQQVLVRGQYNIKFNKNKGKFAKGSIKSKKVTSYGKYGKLAKLKKRKGYKFMGWYTAKTGGTKITKNSYVYITKNTTVYAQWKYKIKFNANKGEVSKKSKKITSGKKYGSLPTPKRSGYTFKGWYTKKKGGTKITGSSYVSKASKHTLYAQWTKKSSATNSKYVTQEEYNKVKVGMTYEEVCKIVGGQGTFLMYVNGRPTYHWYTNSSESNYMSVNFNESSITGTKTVRSKNNTCGW